MSFTYPARPYNFLGLEEQYSGYRQSRFLIFPVPYEQTTTFRKGTHAGPQAIIAASREVELFDEETESEPFLAGIHTLPELEVSSAGPEAMVTRIYNAARKMDWQEKLVCMLGGEHIISLGMVRAIAEHRQNLSVLQLDAHADLRNHYQDTPYSHACIMRRIRELTTRTVSVGVRNLSKEEFDFIRQENVTVITAAEMQTDDNWMARALEQLSEDVYLTIDCDFFNPALLPAVGTPEPGGGDWYQTLTFLRRLIGKKRLVGFDLVELAPLPVNNISEFIAAKLIYKIMAYLCHKT